MKKRSKRESSLEAVPAEPDVTGMIDKIQQSLVSLERKLDTLINRPPQSQARPSFDRPNRHGRDSRDGRGESRQGSGFRDRNFYQVICAECGQNCEVPFKPSGDRPVYCKDCFSKRKDSGGGSVFKGRRDSRDRFVERDFTQDRGRKPFVHKRKKRA